MRVSMSETGSVNLMRSFSSVARLPRSACWWTEEPAATTCQLLPRRFRNPRDFSPQCKPPETQPADAEFAQKRTRASANLAAVVPARGKLRCGLLLTARIAELLLDLRVLHSLCGCSHLALLLLYRRCSQRLRGATRCAFTDFLHARNGMPRCFSNARDCSSLREVVTIVTFMPFCLSTLA